MLLAATLQGEKKERKRKEDRKVGSKWGPQEKKRRGMAWLAFLF